MSHEKGTARQTVIRWIETDVSWPTCLRPTEGTRCHTISRFIEFNRHIQVEIRKKTLQTKEDGTRQESGEGFWGQNTPSRISIFDYCNPSTDSETATQKYSSLTTGDMDSGNHFSMTLMRVTAPAWLMNTNTRIQLTEGCVTLTPFCSDFGVKNRKANQRIESGITITWRALGDQRTRDDKRNLFCLLLDGCVMQQKKPYTVAFVFLLSGEIFPRYSLLLSPLEG